MELINTVFGIPLGLVMYYAYRLVGSYALAIMLFTLITKLIMFPLSLMSQKNSIKMVKMSPLLEDIKQRNSGNVSAIFKEQKLLYKKEKYNSFIGLLPLLLQIPLVLGLVNVIYNPLQHLLHIDSSTIAALSNKAYEVLGVSDLGYAAQLKVMETVQQNASAFLSIVNSEIITKIQSIDFNFLGINLSEIPTFSGIIIIVPILSALSSFLLSAYQNSRNVLQMEQGFLGKWGMALFLVAFSGYFTFVVPCGIGLYWTVGNILSIIVTYACNLIYKPSKYIDYENRPVKTVLSRQEKAEQNRQKKTEQERAKADAVRFFACKKQLVFYSESNGFYKYFSRTIDYILNNSDIEVHYVTSDINDSIFKQDNAKLKAYFVGGRQLISFMMRMDADMVVMTMPDLEEYHIKRSIVKKDVEYVYTDHGMTSFHLMLREHALDHFDTIFCCGPNHIDEVRQTEQAYGLKEKKLVSVGYGLLDTLLENVRDLPMEKREKKQILIAPSWQKDNIMEFCLDELLTQLLHKGNMVILRPHPEFVKRFPGKMSAITNRYKHESEDEFIIETDFSSNKTVYTSDVVITDWSSIAQEFSYATKRPSLFINTPMKIMNPEYKKIEAVPLDISLRDEIGISVDISDFERIPGIIADMTANSESYRKRITEVLEKNIYNIGSSGKAGGEYIINTLKAKQPVKPTAASNENLISLSRDYTYILNGERKRKAEAAAMVNGESLDSFINRAIDFASDEISD